jgi:non-heme chloroperoxidase
MSTFESNGVSLYSEKKGGGDPVVFCHGIPTDYRAWASQVAAFSGMFTTVSYSRRYAAPNTRQGDVSDSTVGNNAVDLKGLLEGLGLGPVHLIGHSYGGFIAAYLAADHPDLVRSLVLIEPAISTLLLEDADSASQMLSLLLRSPSVALAARRFQSSSLSPSLKALDEGQYETAVELNVDGIQGRPGAFASMPEAAKAMFRDNARTIAELRTKFPPFKAHIGKISCRTLVVNGEGSPIWLRRIGELAAASIPKAEAVKIPKSGHFPHMENYSAFNESVLGFLTK